MFDAILIPPGPHAQKLASNGRAIHWVREAFGHLKTIGAVGASVDFVKFALNLPKVSIAEAGSAEVVDSYGVVTVGNMSVGGIGEVVEIVKGAKDFIGAFSYSLSKHRNWDRELDGLQDMVAF
jgi:catalase